MADVYERARPGYPPEAVSWIAQELKLREGRTVLDLGAGTGKLTRNLVETGARVIAVEPGDAMRAVLEQAVPEAETLRGAAEEIPLPDGSVDAITVGQAFHWFRHDEAIPELHRVLRDHGAVALVWNSREDDASLQLGITELLAPFIPAGRFSADEWPRQLEESNLFGPLEQRRFAFVEKLDAARLADRIASISFVAAAAEDARKTLDSEVRALAERHGGVVDFPYVCSVYVSRAV